MAYGKTASFIQLVAEAVLEGFKPYQVILGIKGVYKIGGYSHGMNNATFIL